MKLKVVLMLFLLFFASAMMTTVLISSNMLPSHFQQTIFTTKFSLVQPTGGEPIDDPTGV